MCAKVERHWKFLEPLQGHFLILASKHDSKHVSQPSPSQSAFIRNIRNQNQGDPNGECQKRRGGMPCRHWVSDCRCHNCLLSFVCCVLAGHPLSRCPKPQLLTPNHQPNLQKKKKAAHTHNFGTHATRGVAMGGRPLSGWKGHTRDQRQHQHQRLLVSKGCGYLGGWPARSCFGPVHTYICKKGNGKGGKIYFSADAWTFVCQCVYFARENSNEIKKKQYIHIYLYIYMCIKTKQIAHILGHLMSMMLIGFLN